MGKLEAIKFKAEWMKAIGFVLCTPFCGIIFNLLVNSLDATKDPCSVIKFSIAFCFFAIGYNLINSSLEIMNDYVRDN